MGKRQKNLFEHGKNIKKRCAYFFKENKNSACEKMICAVELEK